MAARNCLRCAQAALQLRGARGVASQPVAQAVVEAAPPTAAPQAPRTPQLRHDPVHLRIGALTRTLRVDPHLFSVLMLSSHMRQCCAVGRQFPKALLVRFVAAVDAAGVARVVPDAAAQLPGRGAYTLACPHALASAMAAHAFTRQLKRHAVPLADLVARTEAALAAHLGAFARALAAPQLGPPALEGATGPQAPRADAARRRGGGRPLPAGRPSPSQAEPLHVWQLCAWDDESGALTAEAPQPHAPLVPPPPGTSSSAARVLFALRRSELDAALGAAGVAAWDTLASSGGGVTLPARVSAALSAAQWRLEPFRPGCRPPGLRASGEAPPGWLPPGWAPPPGRDTSGIVNAAAAGGPV